MIETPDQVEGIINPAPPKPKPSIWISLRRDLFTGMLILGPIALTIYLLYQLFRFLDGFLARFINYLIREGIGIRFFGTEPVPGLGLIALVLLVLLAGAAARNVFGRWVIKRGQEALDRIPLVNRVYKAFNQISEAIFSGRRDIFKRAVLVEYPRAGIWSVGIVTADSAGMVEKYLPSDAVSVFIVSTPNPTTGFLIFARKSELIDLDIPVEDALKIVISGGIVSAPGEKLVIPS